MPSPYRKRPPESSSRFAATSDASTGLRAQMATPVPSRIRFVRAAIAVSGTNGSRWISTCQALSSPASSTETPSSITSERDMPSPENRIPTFGAPSTAI